MGLGIGGHKKGIKTISFSVEFHYLVTMSYDSEILIWNTLVETPIVKLKLHEFPVVSLHVFKGGLPFVVSIDSKGYCSVLDLRTLGKTFYSNIRKENQIVEGMTGNSASDYFFIVGNQVTRYNIQKSSVKSEFESLKPSHYLYSDKNLEVYMICERVIKVWDIRDGHLLRKINVSMYDVITAVCLQEKSETQIMMGDQSGQLFAFDIFTLNETSQLRPHNSEIIHISRVSKDKVWVSGSIDGLILVHIDKNTSFKVDSRRHNVLRSIAYTHKQDLIKFDVSGVLNLMITTGGDRYTRNWDFECCSIEGQTHQSSKSIITIVKFIKDYPLFLACDDEGGLSVWGARYSETTERQFMMPEWDKYADKCLYRWKNTSNLGSAEILSLDYLFERKVGNFQLVIGDSLGFVKILSLQGVYKRLQLKKIKPQMIREHFPFRVCDTVHEPGKESLKFKMPGNSTSKKTEEKDMKRFKQMIFSGQEKGLLPDGDLLKTIEWQAHQGEVFFVKFVKGSPESFYILSGSTDETLKVSSSLGKPLGSLKQNATNPKWKLAIAKKETNKDKIEEFYNKSKEPMDKFLKSDFVPPSVTDEEIFSNLMELDEMLGKNEKFVNIKKLLK